MGVNSHGSTEKVKLLLNSSHLEPQAVKPPRHRGAMTQSSRSLAFKGTPNLPSWRAKCQSGFTTLSPVLLQEQPDVILLLEGALVSWSLAMYERGEHGDLRSSGRRSVISYVHGRTELYYSSVPCLSLSFHPPFGSGVYPGLL
jgi:hypothetical protein